MIVYKPESLKIEIEECIKFLKQKQTGDKGIQIDIIDDFSENPKKPVEINETSEVELKLDNCDKVKLSVRELLDLVDESKQILVHNKSMCISKKSTLIRITECEHEDCTLASELLGNEKNIFETTASINNKKVSISLIGSFSLFALNNHFNEFYGRYFESFTNLDKFIKIIYTEQLTENEVLELAYAYIFELSASHDQNYMLEDFYYDEDLEDPLVDIAEDYKVRPLLIGNGLSDVIKIFSKALVSVNTPEFSITQYSRILEFISQTVIRTEINRKAMTKLNSRKALDPDAKFIRELESLFDESVKSDSEAVRITIKNCCDIREIIEAAPEYLMKVKNLSNEKPKGDKSKILDEAYDYLAAAISETRNSLSHAKSNYIMKGNECPAEQLGQFADMMKILAVQAIRWFGKVHPDNRVV